MANPISCDVLIVGGGLAGLATAYHLSKRSGLKIALLEKESEIARHASGRNAGMLRQAVDDANVLPLIQETAAAFRNPPEDWRRKNFFRKTGSLLLGTKNKIESLHEKLTGVGGRAEIFLRGSLPNSLPREMQAWLVSADYQSLLWTPDDGVVDANALNENFFHAAVSRGVEWFPSCRVEAFQRDSSIWEARAGNKIFLARVIVNAAGAWAGELAASAGAAREELQGFRRHLMIGETGTHSKQDWPLIWDVDHEFYFRSEQGNWLLSPGDEDPHPASDPASDVRANRWLQEKLTRHLPAFDAVTVLRTWACLRTKCANGGSYIAWDRAQPGFFWVAALGGHGVSSCWGVGKRAASEILTQIP